MVLLDFKLTIASGVPSIGEDLDGVVTSVADTGTGVYTVVLSESWYGLKAFGAHSAATDFIIVVPTETTGLVVRCFVNGAGTAADTDGDIDVMVLARRNDA